MSVTIPDWENEYFYICETCQTKHRFPRWPTEEQSYRDGFLSGLTWRDAWERSKPGGPWILSGCKASLLAHKAWIAGWEKGHECKLKKAHPPLIDLPCMSFIMMVAEPRFSRELDRIDQQIEETNKKLIELSEKRGELLVKRANYILGKR